MGQHSLSKVVKNLLSSASIDGYFTNHSLRRSGASRLFQANVDRKLVKEATGHSSDAVDAYQITSDAQRQKLSEIIAGQSTAAPPVVNVVEEIVEKVKNVSIQCNDSNLHVDPTIKVAGGIVETCNCKCQIGDLIQDALLQVETKSKRVVKIEISIE